MLSVCNGRHVPRIGDNREQIIEYAIQVLQLFSDDPDLRERVH